jgi:hypothetical protein
MANNNPFEAALRAHVFHRSFLGGEEAGNHSGESLPDLVSAAPRSPDFAQELETALMRDLNATAAGLRPLPKKLLLRDRPSDTPSAAPAAAKSISLTDALRQLPPAAWPAGAKTVKVSPYAPPRELQAGSRIIQAGEASKMPDYPAEARSTPRHHDGATAIDQFDDDETAASEPFDGPHPRTNLRNAMLPNRLRQLSWHRNLGLPRCLARVTRDRAHSPLRRPTNASARRQGALVYYDLHTVTDHARLGLPSLLPPALLAAAMMAKRVRPDCGQATRRRSVHSHGRQAAPTGPARLRQSHLYSLGSLAAWVRSSPWNH